jgi:hypothetical protein
LRLLQCRLKGSLVQTVKKLTMSNVLAFLEMDGFDLPVYLRANLDRLIGLNVPDSGNLNGNVALFDR